MGLLRKRSWWQKVLNSRLTLAFVFMVSVFIAFAVYDRYVIEREMAERKSGKEAELLVLKERKASLESRVEHLKGDQGIEAEIRRHFDVAKEGERVIVLTGERTVAEEDKRDIGHVPEKKGWWRSLMFWQR